jgi:hypothetical protein
VGELLDQTFGPIVLQVPSSSTNGLLYDVRKSAKGELRCSCPGFMYRQTCKHLRDAALPAPTAPGERT